MLTFIWAILMRIADFNSQISPAAEWLWTP